MGTYWLNGTVFGFPALDQVINGAGLPLQTWDGWQTRSRSSGGFNKVLGIVVHHTASPSTTSFQSDWSYCAVGHPDAPVANILLGRQGQVGLHAAGAANHAGKGGPWNASGGQVPLDSGNSYCIGIEASNNGVGETWDPVMVENYLRLVAALCSAYGLDPTRDIMAHFEWAPTRKIDPFGPTPGFPYGPNQWIMNLFRSDTVKRQQGDEDEVTNPVLMLIAPQVQGISNPAWFVRFASGHLVWASNAETLMCSQLGIAATTVSMGSDQYNRLVAEATAGQSNSAASMATAAKGNVAPDPV